MANVCIAPTAERVAKSAGLDIPIVDTKRRREAFRLVGPVEKMWRDGRIRDGQLAGFRKFERDLMLTSDSKTMLAQYGGSSGGGLSAMESEDFAVERSTAFRRLAEIKKWVEPRTYESLETMVTNDVTLEDIGREVLMIANRPQAKAAAERTLQQGTWTLAVFYGCLTPSEIASIHPG